MCNYQEKLKSRIKRYLQNLLLALLGRDPYRKEIEATNSKLAKAMEDVHSLKEMYAEALATWEKSARLVAEYEQQVKDLKDKSAVRGKRN